MDVVQFWNFFLQSTFIYLFWSIYNIFSNLTKNAPKTFKLEKEFKRIFFSCPKYDFLTKNNYKFFSTMISLHVLHFYVSYEEID